MKFVDGLMIHSGDPVNDYVDSACRHVLLRQGVLGIKVMINIVMLATFSKAPPRAALPCRSSVEADQKGLGVVSISCGRHLNQTLTSQVPWE